MRNDLM